MVLVALPASGQIIGGVVVADEDQASPAGTEIRLPVAGAEVELLADGGRTARRAVTDSLGAFSFSELPAGRFGLRVSHADYLPFEAGDIDVRQEEAVSVEIRLAKEAVPLQPLIVTARVNAALAGFHERRTGSAFGTYLTREEVEARGAGFTTDLLRGLPGIRLKFVRWGVGPAIAMQGGFGVCEPTIFVDGVQLSASAGGSLNDFLTPARIEGVEVYSSISTVPAQFHTGTCGVILFWTQRGERGDGKPWGWLRMLLGVGVATGLMLWIG